MKVLFLTNMPAYHQIELAEQLNDLLGEDNFRLSVFAPLSDERKQMRWHDSYQAKYLLRFSEDEQHRSVTHEWIKSADVVIHGRFPIKHVRTRIKSGGLTFAYQERFWKKPKSLGRMISRAAHLYKNYFSVNKANYHLLAAGCYAAQDLNNMGLFNGRAWKFGYFIDSQPLAQKSNDILKLIWCGRMIDLKQPEVALQAAKALDDAGLRFKLTMVGGGELLEDLKQQADSQGLSQISFTDWLSISEVNEQLAKSDVLLMTSNHREGWGMVVNEAINNGCFVVVNRAVGSASWLIEDAKTGLLYDNATVASMLNELVEYCRKPEQIQAMANAAHAQLSVNWSSAAAAERFLKLSECLLAGKSGRGLYQQGPCSAVNSDQL